MGAWCVEPNMTNYWDLAANMTTRSDYWDEGASTSSDYWGIPIHQSPYSEYWNIETLNFNDPQQMILMDMAAASLESVFDEGAMAAIEEEQQRGLVPVGVEDNTLTIDLGAGRQIQLYIPEEAKAFVRSTVGELASKMASTLEYGWGKALKEGADIDEFVWWPKLKDSTVKTKEQEFKLTPERAKIPNIRTGDLAGKLMEHAWGPPMIEEQAGGLVVSFGPKRGTETSYRDLKYREMFEGAGPGTPNPVSGRGFQTMRPPRPFGFIPALWPAFDQLIRDWIGEVNILQQQFGMQQIDSNTLLWSM